MSVSNGQDADETTFNDAFLSRTVDSDTIGVVGLANTVDPNSGDAIVNIQRAVNELFEADGTDGEGDASRTNYASNFYLVDGDSRKIGLERLDAALRAVALATFTVWVTHVVTDGQAATALTSETADSVTTSSVIYEFEIIRGTTVISNGRLSLQCLNGTWRVETSAYEGEDHGVTFSVSQSTTIGQLKAALDSGAGNGTIKMSRRLVAV